MNQRRISDVSFVIDNKFNVLSANRSFLFLFNITDFHINIADYMDKTDADNFARFLETYSPDNFNTNFVGTLKPRDCKLICIFKVTDGFSGQYGISLQELPYSRDMLENALIENREYSAILNNFDTHYFVYDGSVLKLKNTKAMNTSFEGSLEDFKSYFEATFKLDVDVNVNRLQVESFITQTGKMNSGKTYKILTRDGSFLSITTFEASTREKRIIIGLLSGSLTFVTDENAFAGIRDGLTGLFNKETITDMAIKKINCAHEEVSLIIIDLDKFKECNDTYGHAFGDKVLVAVSDVIKESVEGFGIAGRIGGDEFLVVLDKTSEDDIRTVARNIRLGIQWSLPAIEPDTIVTCSMGVARCPLNASSYEELFKIADKCLYIAKNKGRNCYIIYKPEIHDSIFSQQKKDSEDVLSGSLFMKSASAEMEITTLLSKENRALIPQILDRLIQYMGLSKITVYDPESFKVLFMAGRDETDWRKERLSPSYYRFFNDNGFIHLDNTNIFNTIDREMHRMYTEAQISSTIEILCKDDSGRNRALICFDIYKPARSFDKEKIIFAIMAAKMIAKIV